MLVENYSNSRSRQTHTAVEAIFSDLRVNNAEIILKSTELSMYIFTRERIMQYAALKIIILNTWYDFC